MTCKDCIHIGVCYAVKAVGENQESDKYCMSFKNKADYTEMKHGKWITETFRQSQKKFITCSCCKSVIDCSYTSIDENEFDYCPYRNAKMDG